MKIGVDLSSLNNKSLNQGVHRYAEGLLTAFKNKRNYNFQIYVNEDFYNYAKKNYKFQNFKVILLKKKNFFIKKLLTFFIIFFGYLNIKIYNLHFLINNFLNRVNKKIIEDNSDVIIFINAHENSYNISIKKIINFHDVLHKTFPKFLNKKEKFLRDIIYKNCSQNSDIIVASSNAIRKDFINLLNVKNSKIRVINEGVDLSKFTQLKLKKKFNLPKDYFFYPAQFWKHKNHIQLIEFVQKFIKKNNINLNIIFSGKKKSNYAHVIKYIRDLKLNNFRYIGEISFQNLIYTYINSKFVVVPSLHESSSLVILEAIALKKNVIASNIKPFLEMNKIFKLHIYDLNNFKSFEKTLKKLLTTKKNKLKYYSDYNYNKLKDYSWDVIAKKYIDLAEILNNRS